MTYCDSCIQAAGDEGADGFEEEALAELGAEIADHLCDKRESEGEVPCDCPCNR